MLLLRLLGLGSCGFVLVPVTVPSQQLGLPLPPVWSGQAMKYAPEGRARISFHQYHLKSAVPSKGMYKFAFFVGLAMTIGISKLARSRRRTTLVQLKFEQHLF